MKSLAVDSKYFVYPPLLPCQSQRNILSHKSMHTERKNYVFQIFLLVCQGIMYVSVHWLYHGISICVEMEEKTTPYEIVINLRRQKPNENIIEWQLCSAWMHLLLYKSFNGQRQEHVTVVHFFHFICEID